MRRRAKMGHRSLAALLPVLLGATLAVGACASGGPPGSGGPQEVEFAPSLEVDLAEMTRKSSGVYVQDLVEGVGQEVGVGDVVRMQYVGWLPDGTRFDSSLARGEPFEFKVGRDQAISGWDRGVRGMKEGGQRRLVVPPALGYGARGAGEQIPPNTTLVFQVQVLAVNP